MSNEITFPLTPITEETFERQEWEMVVGKEEDEDGAVDEYYYWVLPLPKDNPDQEAPVLISTANDDYEEFQSLKKGEYYVEIDGMYGLGFCQSEEELEILYRALTKTEIE
jgi:hypothetical protein